MGIKVLSLFDGMACGLQALKQAGFIVDEYHAFEIDKAAIEVAKKNHPEIIHHGEINFLTNFEQFEGIDLLIGGSPCQGFSFAGKQLAMNDPRSVLFFEYVRAKKEAKPKWFLLENVKMKQTYLDIISGQLSVKPFFINSRLVSAQNRQRFYWFNWDATLPDDSEIYCGDVFEENNEPNSDGWQNWWKRKGDFQIKKAHSKILEPDSKAICMTARQISSWNGNLVRTNSGRLRFITPLEAERLQTLPENYSSGVSKTQRYKMIGNGWTVAVIEHLFRENEKMIAQNG